MTNAIRNYYDGLNELPLRDMNEMDVDQMPPVAGKDFTADLQQGTLTISQQYSTVLSSQRPQFQLKMRNLPLTLVYVALIFL